MAAYITGLVIERNGEVFLGNASVYRSAGVILPQGIGVITGDIPTPGNSNGGAAIDGDFWAVPVNDGTLAGFTYLPYNLNFGGVNSVQPNPQAFPVVKISLQPQFGSDYFYVVGTSSQYLTAAGGGAAMPTNIVYGGASVLETGCQTLCNQNATTGLYFAVLGLPTITGPNYVTYYPYGYFNGVALPAAAAAGYATVTLLLAFLNTATTGWAAVGTWTQAANGPIIVTEAAGPGTDLLCASIVAINPSA